MCTKLSQKPWDNPVDVVIVGAGASGLFCAAQLGYRGFKVLVIDHAPKAASKIRISGGGRCNFTNLNATPANYLCHNPHFVKSALAQFKPEAFVDLVDRHGLEYVDKAPGQLFCKERAGDLIAILRTECDWAGVEISLKTEVDKVSFKDELYSLETSEGLIQTPRLIVATGSLSYPKLKASDFGHRIAQQFGLKVTEMRAGLVPFVMPDSFKRDWAELSGTALDVVVSNHLQQFAEPMLITHQGLSGPAILQISNYWLPGESITINLLPNDSALDELQRAKAENKTLSSVLKPHWPNKFRQRWLELNAPERSLAELSNAEIEQLASKLNAWEVWPEKTEGYAKAEVTLGGVDTDEVSSKTLEAKKQKGLYFIGEVLDVTGQLGGFNFQWAWSSAYACAMNIEKV